MLWSFANFKKMEKLSIIPKLTGRGWEANLKASPLVVGDVPPSLRHHLAPWESASTPRIWEKSGSFPDFRSKNHNAKNRVSGANAPWITVFNWFSIETISILFVWQAQYMEKHNIVFKQLYFNRSGSSILKLYLLRVPHIRNSFRISLKSQRSQQTCVEAQHTHQWEHGRPLIKERMVILSLTHQKQHGCRLSSSSTEGWSSFL